MKTSSLFLIFRLQLECSIILTQIDLAGGKIRVEDKIANTQNNLQLKSRYNYCKMQGSHTQEKVLITESIYYFKDHYSNYRKPDIHQYETRAQQRSLSNKKIIVQRCTPPKNSMPQYSVPLRVSPLKQSNYVSPLKSRSSNLPLQPPKTNLLRPTTKPDKDHIYSSTRQPQSQQPQQPQALTPIRKQPSHLTPTPCENKPPYYPNPHYCQIQTQLLPHIKVLDYIDAKINHNSHQKHHHIDTKTKQLIFSKIDPNSPSFSNILEEFRTQRSEEKDREERVIKEERQFEQMQHIVIQEREEEENSRELPQFSYPVNGQLQTQLEEIYKGSFKIAKPKH